MSPSRSILKHYRETNKYSIPPKRFFTYFWTLGLILFIGCQSERLKDGSSSHSSGNLQIVFEDVTLETGLADFHHVTGAIGEKLFPESMGSGAGFIDYNGDDWQDVLLVGGGVWSGTNMEDVLALRLYRNNRDGTFSEVTSEAGLGNLFAYGFGIAAADYDNDGDEDFYFTTLWQNKLFRNDGGVFVDVSALSGAQGDSLWSTSAIFFDADLDGWADLYVGSYVKWSPETDLWCTLDGVTKNYCTPELYEGIPSRYYHNNGDGTFLDESKVAGFIPAPGKTLGVAEMDLNVDGWPDLVVTNDTQRDLLYVNDGDGTFTEMGAIGGMAYDENGRARAGMGIDVGVVDSTGKQTIFVGNFSKEMIGVYRHRRDSFFEDRAATSKIGRTSLMTLTFGLFLFDVELDGDLDLFTANGHVQFGIEETQDGIYYREPCHLFLNDGKGQFSDIVPTLGGALAQPIVGRGAAFADYDRNGTVDILVTENDGPVHLFQNKTEGNHFLRVSIESVSGTRDGLGTRLTAVINNERMDRRVRTGSSFLSNLETTVTFGLGKEAQVDTLYVYWSSGAEEVFTQIASDQEIVIREGTGFYTIVSSRRGTETDL